MRTSITFDGRPLRDALKQYMHHTRRSLPEVLQKQAHMLISGGKGYAGMYQEAQKHAPETINEIKKLPKTRGWRIKRKRGGGKHSAVKEIKRRLKFAGYVQSTGWFNVRYGKKSASGAPRSLRAVSNPRGKVVQNLSGLNPFITLINVTGGAGAFARKTGYVDRAIKNRAKDMLTYVQKKIQDAAKRAKLST
jgi:hypothetical protein